MRTLAVIVVILSGALFSVSSNAAPKIEVEICKRFGMNSECSDSLEFKKWMKTEKCVSDFAEQSLRLKPLLEETLEKEGSSIPEGYLLKASLVIELQGLKAYHSAARIGGVVVQHEYWRYVEIELRKNRLIDRDLVIGKHSVGANFRRAVIIPTRDAFGAKLPENLTNPDCGFASETESDLQCVRDAARSLAELAK